MQQEDTITFLLKFLNNKTVARRVIMLSLLFIFLELTFGFSFCLAVGSSALSTLSVSVILFNERQKDLSVGVFMVLTFGLAMETLKCLQS
jgi:hypothetical protein